MFLFPGYTGNGVIIHNSVIDIEHSHRFLNVIKFPFKRKACQVYEVKRHNRATKDHFVLFLSVKHHSEKLVMLGVN